MIRWATGLISNFEYMNMFWFALVYFLLVLVVVFG